MVRLYLCFQTYVEIRWVENRLLPYYSGMFLSTVLSTLVQLCGVVLFQRSQTQSPTPPKPPSPSFELGLSNFPPLPGAAGHLKTEDLFENRLSSLLLGSKDRVRYMSQALLLLAFTKHWFPNRNWAELFTHTIFFTDREGKGFSEATQILNGRVKAEPRTGAYLLVPSLPRFKRETCATVCTLDTFTQKLRLHFYYCYSGPAFIYQPEE